MNPATTSPSHVPAGAPGRDEAGAASRRL